MKVLISACLLGDNCKYNGGNNYSLKLKEFIEKNNCEVVKYCPEMLGGLPSPRNPLEYVNGKLIDANGKNYDDTLEIAKRKIKEILDNNHFDLVITKAKSPSCGSGEIYDGTFSHTIVAKDGFAVEMIKNKGIKVITENDL